MKNYMIVCLIVMFFLGIVYAFLRVKLGEGMFWGFLTGVAFYCVIEVVRYFQKGEVEK